jgi:exopolysaccharide production protein ExoQ
MLALASSNIDALNIPIARTCRWAILGLLLVLSLGYALTAPRRRGPIPRAWVLAAALAAFALVSTGWSPAPGLTFGRSLSFAALLAVGLALAYGAAGRPRAVGQILVAMLAAAIAVALGGLLELWIAPERALVDANIGSPARYNGLGANPNTMAMLMALALPLAVWAVAEAWTRTGKATAVAAFLLLDGSLVASGSRGAAVGLSIGLVVIGLALAHGRGRRTLVVLGVGALLVVNVGIMQLPPNAERDPPPETKFGGVVPLGPRDAQFLLPLEAEIGFPKPGDPRVKRGLFETSGRTGAWLSALEQAAQRPLLGYGFGIEEEVFVDRHYLLLSGRPENSYVGTVLQLGAVGSAIVLALLVALLVRGRRASAAAESRRVAGACASVVACGLVIAVTQSFLTSVGSPIAAPVWLCAFLFAGLGPVHAAAERRREIRPATSAQASATNASSNPRTGIANRASTWCVPSANV